MHNKCLEFRFIEMVIIREMHIAVTFCNSIMNFKINIFKLIFQQETGFEQRYCNYALCSINFNLLKRGSLFV